ncbi:hypothetical protein RHOFW104T7_01835 [Rhodanobacter thiooxydans]|uniref:Uncharacterized protein n=1 Tax=Rhodanobacter thiooxydans TaxID=416169 RepID=A0A154QDH9_9GAMM|nr:hypothetical protein [Rhodanobacter thiooxydans]KZC22204.1 hypothetical protein RHOFW104T7_01835 [Rhodanobacter thiooxydans]
MKVAEHPEGAGRVVPPAEADAPPALYEHLLAGPAIFQMAYPPAMVFRRACLPACVRKPPAPRPLRARSIPIRAVKSNCGVRAPRILCWPRGVECRPSRIFITAGFAGAPGTTLRVLGAEGREAWKGNPGFFQSRKALELARLIPVPIPVDEDGVDVSCGMEKAPAAALAQVTPGQQAPLGTTLSLKRRIKLLVGATRTGAWITPASTYGPRRREPPPACAGRWPILGGLTYRSPS